MPDLFKRPVLTTNFDQAIERVYRAKGRPDFTALDPASRDLRNQTTQLMKQPCVFKLHGTVAGDMTDYDTLVFTQAQYDRHYGPGGDAREALQHFVGKGALLFLGCSLEGDRTVDVLREMAGPGVIHYAVVSCNGNKKDERIRELAEAGIRAIVYEEGRHESVRVVLEQLSAKQNKASRQGIRMPSLCKKGAVFAAVFLVIVVTTSIMLFWTSSVLSVVSSRAVPFTSLGYYATTHKTPPTIEGDLETEKAFSILSFLQEAGDGESLVEAMRMDVSDLNPISEPVVKYDAAVKDNTFYVFAINDGWGPSNEEIHLMVTKELSSYNIDKKANGSPLLNDLCKSVDVTDRVALPSGGVCRTARLELDIASFLKYGTNDPSLNMPFIADLWISVVSTDNNVLNAWRVVYRQDDGFSVFLDGGGGTPVPRTTFFGVLDVDRGPQSIHFEGPESSVLVDGWLGIETAVAPTKSCELNCRDVFAVRGKEIATEEFHVKVTVPCYDDSFFGLFGDHGSKIMQAIMDEPGADSQRLKEIIAQYRYRPEMIAEQQHTSLATEERETTTAASTATSVQEARSAMSQPDKDDEDARTPYRERPASSMTFSSASEAYAAIIDEWRDRIAYDRTEEASGAMRNAGNWYYSVSPSYVAAGSDEIGNGFVYCYRSYDAFDDPMLVVAGSTGQRRVYGMYQYVAKENAAAVYTAHFRHHKFLCEDQCLRAWNNTAAGGSDYNTAYWSERPSGYHADSDEYGKRCYLDFSPLEIFLYNSGSDPTSHGELTDLAGSKTMVSTEDGRKAIDDLHPAAMNIA